MTTPERDLSAARGPLGGAPAQGPLGGLQVLDLSALAPGPFATMLLGDLGADIVTVEPPPRARAGSTLEGLAHHGGLKARAEGTSPLHRSRRSIVVNLKEPAGLEIALRLAERADAMVEGFRPGTCERLGLGYSEVSARNPGIVYCSITGYGQDGKIARRAGHDLNYLAEAGLLSATTRPGQRPGIPINAVADFAAGGLVAAFGILAALHGRAASGRGTYIDVSMYEGLLGLLQVVPAWIAAGSPDPSWGGGLLSGAVPFYDCYLTSDGRWLSVGALEPKFFANLCHALGREDLIEAQFDPQRWGDLRSAFEEAFASATLEEWTERLAGVDTAFAPVRSVTEGFEVARRRGLVEDAKGVPRVRPLPSMTGWKLPARRQSVRAGEDTRELMTEVGYTPGDIDRLAAEGIVGI